MLKTAIAIDLVGNLIAQAHRSADAIRRFAHVSDTNLQRVSRVSKLAVRGLDALGNQYTALLSALATGGSATWVNTWEEQLGMLRLNTNATTQDINTLKAAIFATAQAPDIRISPENLKEAVETIVEVTGNLDLARDNLHNIGVLMRASGAAGRDVGAMFSELYEKAGLTNAQDILIAVDTLRKQGEAGAFTIKNLSAEGAKLANAFGALGYKGQSLVTQMGAFAQMAMKATGGSAAEAATATEAMLRDVIAKSAQLEKAGVRVWDAERSKKEGRQVARDMGDILADILKKTRGEQVKLRQIFSDEGMRVVNTINTNPAMLQQFLAMQADGVEIQQEAAEAARSLSAALTNLHSAWKQFADTNLSGPLQGLADTLNNIEPERMQTLIKGAAGVAAAVGALVVARKGWKLASAGIEGIRYLWSGKPGALGAMAGLNVQKVFITNWPLGMMGTGDSSPLDLFGGGAAPPGQGGKPAGRLSRLAQRLANTRAGRLASRLGRGARGLTRFAAPALGVLAAGATAYDVYGTMSDEGLGRDEKRQRVSSSVGQLGGGLAGAKLGAVAGTMLMPGVGTVVGGLAGGALGAWGGGAVLEWAAKQFNEPRKVEVAPQELQGKIALEIIGGPPMRLRSADMSNNLVEVDVDSGMMMGWQ